MKSREIKVKEITTEDKKEQYKLVYGKNAIGLKDAIGKTLKVVHHAIYDVLTEMDDGEIRTSHCLALMTNDGTVYVTTSATAIYDYSGIVEYFGASPTISIVGKKSTSNKQFITIDIA